MNTRNFDKLASNVREHLASILREEEYDICEENMLDELRSAKTVHKEEVSQHRWWNVNLYVVELGTMLIGFEFAHANRDESVFELGWEFDWTSVQEMRTVVELVTVYVPVDVT